MTEHEREAMDDELRKACERWREFRGAQRDFPELWKHAKPSAEVLHSGHVLADAYLATTREDDGEAWQGELWVSSTGAYAVQPSEVDRESIMRDQGWRLIQVREVKEAGGGA